MKKRLSINTIKEINENYSKKKKELEILLLETEKLNSMIDLCEVENDLSYSEVSELLNIIDGKIEDNDVLSSLIKIKEKKKEEEYPEILDAHYFPIIKKINLPQECRLLLDKNLNRLSRYVSIIEADIFGKTNIEKSKQEYVLNFLIENNVIEKTYVFHCTCGDTFECENEYISEEEKKEFYEYHSFDYDAATDDEIAQHEEDFEKGYINIPCWSDGSVEICDIDDFEKNLRFISYKVKMKPDRSLDKI